MKKENFKFALILTIAIIASLGISVSIRSLLAAWTPPPTAPPSDNIEAPVNVGSQTQVKSGIFGVTNDFYVGVDKFFVDGSGSGNVGIGTAAPGKLLDVNGSIRGRLDAEIYNTLRLFATNAFATNDYTSIFTERDGANGTKLKISTKIDGGSLAEKIAVLGNGNVGIGTANPSAKLVSNVSGAGAVTGLILNNQYTYGSGVGTAAAQLAFGRDPGSSQSIISAAIDGGNESETTSNPGYMAFSIKSDVGTLTERMRINSAGNVGIGTDNPGGKLGVKSSGVSDKPLRVLASDGGEMGYFFEDAGQHTIFDLFDGAGGNDIRLNTNDKSWFTGGNVGIGTNDPNIDSILHLKSSADAQPRLTLEHSGAATSPFGNMVFSRTGYTAANGDYISMILNYGLDSAGSVTNYGQAITVATDVADGTEDSQTVFSTMKAGAVTDTLTLNSGNVGIGTPSPAYKLEVVGTIKADQVIGCVYN